MYNKLPPPQLPANNRDAIKFLYKDGILPVAHAKAKVLALGKTSDPKSDTADDFEAWVGLTDGNGEVSLSHPDLIQGMNVLEGKVKRENPGLNRWYYAPLPAQRPTNVMGYARTPNIPLVVEIDDEAVSAPTLQIDLIPQTFTTSQSRPPIGEINGKSFQDPLAFVKQLAQRYSKMDVDRGSISLKLTRCGSPAPPFLLESSWLQLILQMGTTRSDFQLTTAYTKKFRGLRDHIAVAVLGKVLAATNSKSKPVAGQYQDILNQMAGLVSKGPLPRVDVPKLMSAISTAFAQSSRLTFLETPLEDYVLVATMFFLVGAIARGYLWGTLEKEKPASNFELTAKINTTTSCSIDEFESYCELMRP